MNFKRVKRILFWALLVPITVISLVLLVVYFRQDAIVQSQIASLNTTFEGEISVGDVHLAPFENFPYISLKIDDVVVRENKTSEATELLNVADIYVGFTFWDILRGNYAIHSLTIEDGVANLIVHPDGKTNLENALTSESDGEESGSIDVHLQRIEFTNLDIHQLQEATGKEVETLIYWAKGGLNTKDERIQAHVDSEFELNVIDNGDTTYLKHKHFEFHTDLVYEKPTGMLVFKPSGITMEHGDFQLEGSLDTRNENTVDLTIKGTKPSFDMFIAFAPTELIPVLERYENAGKIYFEAKVQGPTQGQQPAIDVRFGAEEAYLENPAVKKRIDAMGFVGHFTNGAERNLQTMEFSLTDISANLEEGKFVGNVVVKNFEAPEIDMQVNADFDLPFLIGFLNLDEVEDVSGSVAMDVRFHDIIDIDNPGKALQELNRAYFAELTVEDFAFRSEDLPAQLSDLDIHLEMNGKQAQLDQFDMVIGNSNLSLDGMLSDLPAIVHHTPTPVVAKLNVRSDLLDIAELTRYSAKDSLGFNERIKDLRLAFSFNALGNAFTEFTHLPKGEFFIDDLYADLEQYPHTLHDFHADVWVKDEDLNIIDFTGIIDSSDFHFNGLIHDYSSWMQEELHGNIAVDITLRSDLLKLKNLLSYQGVNHVPEDYRQEEIEGLELHMLSTLNYDRNALQGVDIVMDKLEGKMHVHPLRFEDFSGKLQFADAQLSVQDFRGTMGRSTFRIDMNYFLGDTLQKQNVENSFKLNAPFIDFDALSNFETKAEQNAKKVAETNAEKVHEEAFNIYELPFSDMSFDLDIDHFIYHRLDLQNISGRLRTTQDHYIYVDTIHLEAAGGEIALSGYFNGSDPEHIYFKPNMALSRVDLDKLLFKFENFGQDAIVSENLHGKLNADITGNIRVYPDFVPDLDKSEVHLDVQVLDGRLENYDPILLLSDYFGEAALTSIQFDTLQNHMDFTYGKITIPNMTIESTLGHMDISGTQTMSDSIDYYARIPWDLVKGAAKNKLFGRKEDDAAGEIIEVDTTKKVRYLNVNITGTFDDYKVKLRKNKKEL